MAEWVANAALLPPGPSDCPALPNDASDEVLTKPAAVANPTPATSDVQSEPPPLAPAPPHAAEPVQAAAPAPAPAPIHEPPAPAPAPVEAEYPPATSGLRQRKPEAAAATKPEVQPDTQKDSKPARPRSKLGTVTGFILKMFSFFFWLGFVLIFAAGGAGVGAAFYAPDVLPDEWQRGAVLVARALPPLPL